MKAITFDGAIPRYLATKAAGAISPGLLTGAGRCTVLDEVGEPELPGDRWVRIRTTLGGRVRERRQSRSAERLSLDVAILLVSVCRRARKRRRYCRGRRRREGLRRR